MSILFAYHKIDDRGPFPQNNYFTSKKNAKVGDEIFVISGKREISQKYFLEGRYVIESIDELSPSNRKLNLAPISVPSRQIFLNSQSWFDNKEFHAKFTSGQSLNPVPENYIEAFDNILVSSVSSFRDTDYENVPNVDKPDIGTDTPGKASSEYNIYLRDDAVRQAVLNRANGKCEYCGRHTFKVDSGKYYLETHHIIALSKEGKDRISNVIALCPEDHRRAHYATNRLEVEKKMIEIVSRTSK